MLHKLNKRAVVMIVAIVAIVAVVGTSLAWFVTRSSLLQEFGIAGFDVSADVYFVADGKKVTAEDYKDEDGLYILSLNKADKNYIGNLRMGVALDGGKACVRVTMNHEWRTADGTVSLQDVSVPYKFDSLWYDNRETDYSVYYTGKDMSGKADFSTAELIKGFDAAKFNSSDFADVQEVRLLIQVDAVQVNRYPQIWGIEKLPWK